jgi:hypothetical protein
LLKKGTTEQFCTHTENIGAGGICVVLEKQLDKFCLVELVLYLQDGYPPVECDARVVWSVKRQEEFDTGIEFLNIRDKDVLRLERIIQACLKSQEKSSRNKPTP